MHLSLDFVSRMAVECNGGLMGHGRVSLYGDLVLKSLRSFCGKGGVLFSASGVPPKEGVPSNALGTGG